MKKIYVNIPESPYNIEIEHGLLKKAGEEIKKVFKGERVYVITDSNVEKLYAKTILDSLKENGYETHIFIVKAGEESKSIDTLKKIYSFLIEKGASRKDLIVALGGGVIGDMAGFAAATYMRGVPFIQVPTSLLAQIDSSIGGKVAVNLPEGKNLVGAFYQPILVIIDPECLKDLPRRVLSDGAAEALKYGYIKDRKIYDIFRKIEIPEDLYKYSDEIIYRCCEIKRIVVENDEKENGERMILNFGHTLGHAYESYWHYKKYTHGEAVALGMYAICKLSENLGYMPRGTSKDMKEILERLKLPVEDNEADREKIVENILKDKKSNSKNTSVIIPEEIGKVRVEKIPTGDIKEFFRKGGFLS